MSARRRGRWVAAAGLLVAQLVVSSPPVRAQVQATASISGRVVSSAGAGIAGFEVLGVLVGQQTFLATTDATGQFTLGAGEDLPPGNYQVEFDQAGYKRPGATAQDRGEVILDVAVGAGAQVVLPPVVMVKQAIVTGRVTSGGVSVKGADAQVLVTDDPDAEPYAEVSTSSDGRYALSLPPGSYRVSFRKADHFTDFLGGTDYESATLLLLTEGAERDLGDFALVGEGKLALSLVDRAGDGVGPITVKVHSRAPDGTFTVVASRATFSGDGFARLSPLRPGPVWLSFEDPSGARPTFYYRGARLETSTPVTIVAHQQTEIRDYLAPTPRVLVGKRPKVIGPARVGRTLRVSPGTWLPKSSTRTVRWLADGEPIRGANRATYTLTAKERGKRISVRVTARAKGFRAGTATTRPTAKVKG